MKLEQNQDSRAEAIVPAEEILGWDPFEVWKTRVRDPQLRATGLHPVLVTEDEIPLRKIA